MKSNLTDWDEDLLPEPEEVYQDLLRALRRKSGFGLFFVQCTPAEADLLITKIPQDIPQKKIAVLRLVEPIENLYERVAELIKNKSVEILLIKGIEYSLYKYEIGVARERAYRNLITRLGSLVTLRHKIQTWVSLSRERQRSVLDVLQEVIQELLQSDNHMQQQMVDIARFTSDYTLRNALLFASLEEYCLRPVRNQPLLIYRFVNYVRRTQSGGLTQVPSSDLVRQLSEEILIDERDNRINLVDSHAITEYPKALEAQEQQTLQQAVKLEFETYLQENLGQEAVEWLRLYLQGKSQDAIAKQLKKPIKEIYRLREKISYHAIRVFALKDKPELVDGWLSTSLEEHNLGLTPRQWDQLHEKLTTMQCQILELRKAGRSIEEIAQQLKIKTHQAMGEWTKVYLIAQGLRSSDI